MDYQRGTFTVPAIACGRIVGHVAVRWEFIGYSECPACRFDSLAHVIIHEPCGDILWTNCDHCTDDDFRGGQHA